ncbi:elongation factor G [Lentisphaera araneosa HTCC2155]|uniref:Elongation factor G n=1 Tax=Lentisphaera araneosa HTCC2155 TaxID=313628 RepID=A6DQL1_9BACT|nr:elongation factor G [Lentisphaera araneosa]EDM26092.1 elongation factor G [Lentisphaera araneosa HTCC2155]
MSRPLDNVRNIGISAHIDSGKTTLTERILFYTGRIHAIHEVRGKDGVGATMDHMELEKEKGITITSACTFAQWEDDRGNEININIIDTPGHVDFTIEVERSLRVLDGAILVLCGTSGVQSQSITVDRQMKRYNVPRIAFVNKLDNPGSSPYIVTEQLRTKLGHNAIMFQVPIGAESELKGVVDLVKMRSFIFEGENGENVTEGEVPADLLDHATEKREELLEALAEYDDDLMELVMEGNDAPEDMVNAAARKGVLSLELTPVFCGSAYKNVGVQKLLHAVSLYLPSPYDVENVAFDLDNDEEPVTLESDASKDFVGYIFKLEDGAYGQLSYMRIYQGKIAKGDTMINMTNGKKHTVGRLMRVHSADTEDISVAEAGDIIAVFGIDCATGTTFTNGELSYNMTSMFVPAPVIDMTLILQDRKTAGNLSKALNRFGKEDPTFRVRVDEESGETIISGMGELHLEIYVERMKREYKVDLEVGQPQVAYRESIEQDSPFDYSHKKQSGGRGQYGKVVGALKSTEGEFVMENNVTGGNIPKEYISSCEKGFAGCLKEGALIGFPVVNVMVDLQDGAYHNVDSDDISFQLAARGAFREAYARANPVILEPIMLVDIETPTEFQGTVMGNLNSRRGIITGTTEDEAFCKIAAEVPLSEMFGYVGQLRSMTQGKAEYTMEFAKYSKVPKTLHDQLVKEFAEKKK